VPDTSVLVGYLRFDRHRDFLITALRGKSLVLPGVVLCELYAGAASREDRADVEALRRALGAHVLNAEVEDWVVAGRCLFAYSARWGKVRPRDHLADVLVAVAAAKMGATLVSEDLPQMTRWSWALRRLRKPLRVERPHGSVPAPKG
jgi:predicted nucleic acid-binding protein